MSGKNVTHLRALYDFGSAPSRDYAVTQPVVFESKSKSRPHSEPSRRRNHTTPEPHRCDMSVQVPDDDQLISGDPVEDISLPKSERRWLARSFQTWRNRCYCHIAMQLRSLPADPGFVPDNAGFVPHNPPEITRGRDRVLLLSYGQSQNGIREVIFEERFVAH
jgi:hypothetical protein